MKFHNIYIYHAKRTPIGKFLKSLSNTSAVDLSVALVKDLQKTHKLLDSYPPDQLIMGQVLTCGLGQNPARQVVINSSLPHSTSASVINQVCGSGMKAVVLGAQSIALGAANNILCGGQENMSLANHYMYARSGVKFGDIKLHDSMVSDGLTDVFNHVAMTETAQYLASKYNISRTEQDQFALNSHLKAQAAAQGGEFVPEICPIPLQNNIALKYNNNLSNLDEEYLRHDEGIRPDITIDKLAKLPTIVKAAQPSITAGNSSSTNDGAAILGVCSESFCNTHNLKPMVRIVSYAEVGIEPMDMGLGPVSAIKKALASAEWTINEVDLFEINEAFAAQVIACISELNIDSNKLNVAGGAIALGHPIGASGARILVTLIHNLIKTNKKKGVASLCIGGGMGIAMCVERC